MQNSALEIQVEQQTESKQSSDWESYKQQAFDKLDKAIVIKRLDQPLQTEMNVESQRGYYLITVTPRKMPKLYY